MGEKDKEVKEEKKVTTKKETKTDVKKEEKAEQFKKVDPKKIKTDKSQKKESKGKKKATWIIPAVVAVVVLAIIAVLTYMIVTSSDPKKTVDGLFTNLKAGDFENAKEFMVSEEENEETNLFEDEFGTETKDLLFNTLEWKVNKVTEENDEAYVEVEITNKNYKTIITNVMQKVLKAAFSGENVTEDSAQDYMVEELKNDQIDKATVVKEIKLVKVDKKWKVAQNEELVDAVLPGLRDAVNTFSN